MAVMGVLAVLFYHRAEQQRHRVTEIEREEKQLQAKVDRCLKAFDEVLPWFYVKTREDLDLLERSTAKMTEVIPLATERAKQIRSALLAHYAKGIEDLDAAEAKVRTDGKWILDLVEELHGERERLKANYEQASSAKDRLDEELRDERRDRDRSVKEKNDIIDGLHNDLRRQKEEFEAKSAEKDAEIRQIRQSMDELKAARERLKQEKEEQVKNIEEQLAVLKSKYEKDTTVKMDRQKLEVGERKKRSDGTVVKVDPADQSVYLDRGANHRIRLGMRFDVLRREKGGVDAVKGKIEIIEVRDSFSRGRILVDAPADGEAADYDPLDPVLAGDFLDNLIYDPERVPKFVLIGELERFNYAEARRLIEMDGGEVQEDLKVDTDFVVVGKPPNDDSVPPQAQDPEAIARYDRIYQKAVELKIEVLREVEFLRYVRHHP
jgi:hypothetical protein